MREISRVGEALEHILHRDVGYRFKQMKNAQDLIPWKVIDLNIRPFPDFWTFNNSIHFDGETWRCVLRCADYCLPDGKTVRSKNASPTGQQTKNAMVILDPMTWKPIQVFKMQELDGFPRAPTPHRGFEDMRIFQTDAGGLQGIAASLHLQRDHHAADGKLPHQPPEQVVLSFDDEYNIVAAKPIRAGGSSPEKNWVPFDRAVEPRFLYSINKGSLFDDRGRLHGDAAVVRSSSLLAPAASAPLFSSSETTQVESMPPQIFADSEVSKKKKKSRPVAVRGAAVRTVRGGRINLDTQSTRPSIKSARSSKPPTSVRSGNEATKLMGSGKMLLPTYEGLRGGTQLVCVADNAWLGIGHEMKFVEGKKFYWHTWYCVDSRGKMTSVGSPMKLAPNGIEFAAGMAIDGDRVVVSFGVDDMECKLGETSLSAVMSTLRPVESRK